MIILISAVTFTTTHCLALYNLLTCNVSEKRKLIAKASKAEVGPLLNNRILFKQTSSKDIEKGHFFDMTHMIRVGGFQTVSIYFKLCRCA